MYDKVDVVLIKYVNHILMTINIILLIEIP